MKPQHLDLEKRCNAYAIIPARNGSKGVPKKNIKHLGGYPLIAYSIIAARLCKEIDRVIVSTDSQEIADIAQKFGAEVPFLRPEELAQDSSTNMDFIRHALDWFHDHEKHLPDLLIQLLPTTPLRDPEVITSAIRVAKDNPDATSVRSVHMLAEPPQKMMGLQDGFLVGLFPDDSRPEYYNLNRQAFPPAYHPNSYVDIFKTAFVNRSGRLFGDRILAFATTTAPEVDLPEDFEYLEYLVERRDHMICRHLRNTFPLAPHLPFDRQD